MNGSGNVYAGLEASTWDLHRDTRHRWDDAQLFLDLIGEFGQPALDLGCGTGRIVLDFQEHGIDIDGVDNAPEMLSVCRNRAAGRGRNPGLFEQDLRTLDLPRRYGTIFGSSSVIQLFPEPADALAVVKRVRAHLKPGGAFLTPFAFAPKPEDPLDTGWQPHFEKIRPEDGATIRASVREWREPARQWWHTEARFEVVRDGRVVEAETVRRSPEGRWYTRPEAERLFRDAGLEVRAVFKDFTREPAGPDAAILTVLGVAA